MKIAVDIDGTVGHFVQAFSEVAQKHFGIKTDWTRWDMGVTLAKFLEIYDYMIENDLFDDMKPYQGAVETLQSWKKQGHEIVYITRRRPGFSPTPGDHESYAKYNTMVGKHELQTKLWLMKNHFPPGRVIFTQDKGKWCREHEVRILIEDYLHDAQKFNGMLLPSTGQRLTVWLIDRPYNSGDYVPFGEYDYPHRIRSLEGVQLG